MKKGDRKKKSGIWIFVLLLVIIILLIISKCQAGSVEGIDQGNTIAPDSTTEQGSPATTESTVAPDVTEPVPETTSTAPVPETTDPVHETTEPVNVHTHIYRETVVSATCANEGYTLYECACGDSFIADKTPALGHKYEQQKVAATTSSQGYTLHTCSVCNDSYQSDFTDKLVPEPTLSTEPPHSHNYNTAVTNPTCTTQGYTTFTCSCGDSYTDNFIQPKDHSWSEWTITKEPTTSSAGESSRTCSTCGAIETQSISKLPEPTVCQHNWQTKYYPEEGHYTEYFVVCACGYKCATTEDWIAHSKSFSGGEMILQHGSNASSRDYIIDSPERWEWICSMCGEVSDTQP